MSFKQKLDYSRKETSQNKCDGCDKTCDLGYTLCKFGCHIYPTIAKKPIDWYINKNNEMIYTAAPVCESKQLKEQQDATIKLAKFIATHCKHYQSR